MKRALIVAAIAAALLPSPAGAETQEEQAAELARAHNELLDRSAVLSAELHREMGARWRTKALLEVCGEPVPATLNDRRPEDKILIELASIQLPDLPFEELMPILAAAHIGEVYYKAGYADAIRLAFKAGVSRDLICQVALKSANP
jgi:hypothetical protein